MSTNTVAAFEPRKTPVQARSAVTVQAISEATIQILLTHGSDRLTTTRVAHRAGVSVGTLYQYYPNKQSLLFAVLENHLNLVAAAVESACERARHKPLAHMMREMVEAFVDVKIERADISVALYRVSAEIGGPELMKEVSQRLHRAIERMIRTAPDLQSHPDNFVIEMMLAAMSGAMRSVLEAGGSPAMMRILREQLVLLCQSYVAAATVKNKSDRKNSN
jgi:AcrR family transcriptional regulator